MILQDLIILSRVNLQCEFSGMDSLEKCFNKDHFQSYPHPVNYHYNSRGFRDSEWPESLEELKNAIWCVGDSFTVGIGQPYNHTWPHMLAAATGRRCINISMDGASNNWISRRAQQIIKEVAPTHMVVLWSYFHRREHPTTEWPDEQRRLYTDLQMLDTNNDLKNFIMCCSDLQKCSSNTSVFNGAIPNSGVLHSHVIQCWKNIRDPSWPVVLPSNKTEFELLPDHIKNDVKNQALDIIKYYDSEWTNFLKTNQLLELTNLDYSRDYHHFDRITSEFFVQKINEILFSSDQSS
jgi:hypothetical protein